MENKILVSIKAYLVNAFTANGTGGNPAGVVLCADKLSNEDKLKIAQVVGYSETAFVSNDEQVDFEVSFFTVTGEVDFCGHATLAAFATLFDQGLITEDQYVQRTKAGLLKVSVKSNGQIVMEQKLPEFLGRVSNQKISELIGIDAKVLDSTELPSEVISTGLPDIIVPVPQGYLAKIKVDEAATSAYCEAHNIVGIHAFEFNERNTEQTASCRNFAPLFGISEESATGSASGALACYLNKYLVKNNAGTNNFIFEQGRDMRCVSKITAAVDFDGVGITKVSVGGFAKLFGVQNITI